MSGSSFDYAYARAWQFADELAERLDAGVEYGPETVAELRRIVDVARHAGSLMRDAEWLFTGWIDETEFKQRTVDRRLQAMPRPQARAAFSGAGTASEPTPGYAGDNNGE